LKGRPYVAKAQKGDRGAVDGPKTWETNGGKVRRNTADAKKKGEFKGKKNAGGGNTALLPDESQRRPGTRGVKGTGKGEN